MSIRRDPKEHEDPIQRYQIAADDFIDRWKTKAANFFEEIVSMLLPRNNNQSLQLLI